MEGRVTFPPLVNKAPPVDFGGSPRGVGGRRQNPRGAFLTDVDSPPSKQSISFGDSPKVRHPKTKETAYVPQSSSQSQNTTKLLQKRRKNNEWQQALELKREEFAKRMAECDARQAELKKKCKDLRKRVQQKEQEVQETRSKIDRATKKQDEERQLQQEKDAEIEEKIKQVSDEELRYEKLIKDLDRTNRYKQFLDLVCEENEGYFEEVDRILMRYESLSEQQKEQAERLLTNQNTIEDQRDKLGKFSKASVTEVVERNATIASYRKTLDELVAQRKESEANQEKIKTRQQKSIMELGSIEMAVDNLYTRCFIVDQELSKAQTQEVERIMRLPRDSKTLQMLDRLCIIFVDMDHIAVHAKAHPKKVAGSPTSKAKAEGLSSSDQFYDVEPVGNASNVAGSPPLPSTDAQSSVKSDGSQHR